MQKEMINIYSLNCHYSIKTEQGLLVDFGSFAQKFIDLLELCIGEEGSVAPRYYQGSFSFYIICICN